MNNYIDQLGQRLSWPVSVHCPCNCLEKLRGTTKMCAVHLFFPTNMNCKLQQREEKKGWIWRLQTCSIFVFNAEKAN